MYHQSGPHRKHPKSGIKNVFSQHHGSGLQRTSNLKDTRTLHLNLATLIMSDHHHDHSGGCHSEDHDHSNDITPAIQSLLYSQIDFGRIITLNGKIKPWSQFCKPENKAHHHNRNYSQGRCGYCAKDLGGATER